MKLAVIYPVRVAGAHRFAWRWRSEDKTRKSDGPFVYFHDCVEAAKKAGYECKFERGKEVVAAAAEHMVPTPASKIQLRLRHN